MISFVGVDVAGATAVVWTTVGVLFGADVFPILLEVAGENKDEMKLFPAPKRELSSCLSTILGERNGNGVICAIMISIIKRKRASIHRFKELCASQNGHLEKM